MPWHLRQLKHTGLHRLLPGKGFIAGIQYGSFLSKEINRLPGLRKTVVGMARNNSPDFLYWCIAAIARWQGKAAYRKDIIAADKAGRNNSIITGIYSIKLRIRPINSFLYVTALSFHFLIFAAAIKKYLQDK